MKKINPKIRALLQANSILFFECFEYSNWQKNPLRQRNSFGTDIWILKIDLLFFPFSGWMDKSSLVISFGSINTFAISMPIIFTCQSTTFHLRSSYNGIVGGDCISCSNIYSCLVSHLLIFFFWQNKDRIFCSSELQCQNLVHCQVELSYSSNLWEKYEFYLTRHQSEN